VALDVEFPDDYLEETWLGTRDRTDFEWENWVHNALITTPFYIINFIVAVFIPSWSVRSNLASSINFYPLS
jgi:hypothetical protein